MKMFNHRLVVVTSTIAILLINQFYCASVEKKDEQDSYIDALQKTHDEDSIGSRGDYRQSPYSDNSISSHPGYSYGPPAPTPSIEYGPPSFGYNYAPYPSSYGAPVHSSYGPPRPSYNYGPPSKYPIVHSAPRDEHWLLDKFKFKLDLFTIGKILIKLIIFKKIVKFIALICLLLFLPKLQAKHMNIVDLLGGDESEEESESVGEEPGGKRAFNYSRSKQRQINEVSKFALTAIESFTDKHLIKCGNLSDIPCRFQSMVDNIDDKYPYERIIEMFVPVNHYYAYAPKNANKSPHRKYEEIKLPKVKESNQLDEEEIEESIENSTIDIPLATMEAFDDLSTSLPSTSSTISYENSNSNRI